MPELKQIEASIELGPSNTKLKEYGARYSDGHVETFIAVPNTDMPFSIHLKTKHYIAPGISFFVFMDGEYQCNRNKVGFKMPGDGVPLEEYEADFRLRQKEEKTSTGSFVGREWTFAKLNTVAADKAPTLNAEFVRNVGTIEIVAMRCRPASEDPPAERQAAATQAKSTTVPKQGSAKKPTSVSSRAPSKTPSKAASGPKEDDAFGGFMGGIFDGACDGMGLDGANDERPAFNDERFYTSPPAGYYWNGIEGEYEARNLSRSPVTQVKVGDDPVVKVKDFAYVSGNVLDAHTKAGADCRARVKDFIAKVGPEVQNEQQVQTGQFDGNGDWHPTTPGTYRRPQGDDLRGDRYLGMTGRDRSDYKQYFRERGESVSQTPRQVIGTGIMDGFVCNDVAAAEEIKKAPADAKDMARFFIASQKQGYYESTATGLNLFEHDLEKIRQDLHEQQRQTPNCDLTKAWQDWSMMEARLRGMRVEQGQRTPQSAVRKPSAEQPSREQQQALDMIRGLRVEMRTASRIHPDLDGLSWLDDLNAAENDVLTGSVWTKHQYQDEFSYLDARRIQLRDLNEMVSAVLGALCDADPSYTYGKLADRANQIQADNSATLERYQQLQALRSPLITPYAHRPSLATPANHVGFQHGYDGSNWNQYASPTNGGKAQDWEKVGGGATKPNASVGGGWNGPKQSSTHEHFPGERLQTANVGGGAGQQSQGGGWVGAGMAAGSKQGGQGGWDNNQQDNTAWPTPNPASGGGWNHAGSKQGGGSKQDGGGGWSGASQNGSKKSGTRGNNLGNGGGGQSGGGWGAQSNRSQSSNGGGKGGGTWGAQSNKAPSNNGGWGNDASKSNAGDSHSGGRSIARELLVSDPKDLIKPYWKNWNQLVDQRGGSKPQAAREVYTFPAEKLPTVPEGKVASATHGIQTGRGAEYNHLCRRPIYIDSMEKPYAVFSFKYRSKDKLKRITGLKINSIDEDVKRVEKQVQKDKLMQMPKDQLIEQLMKSNKGSRKAPSAAGAHSQGRPASNAGGWDQRSKTENNASGGRGGNGGGQSHAGSAGRAGSRHSKSKKSGSGWGGGNQEWGGGGNGGGWDGQNEAEPERTEMPVPNSPLATEPPGPATAGGFQWNHDAYRQSNQGVAATAGTPGGNWGEREASSYFTDPEGVRWKGARELGRASQLGARDKAGDVAW